MFSKNIHVVSFVQFKCQNSCDLRAFLWINFGLKVLLRVKDLTFCNSVSSPSLRRAGDEGAGPAHEGFSCKCCPSIEFPGMIF